MFQETMIGKGITRCAGSYPDMLGGTHGMSLPRDSRSVVMSSQSRIIRD